MASALFRAQLLDEPSLRRALDEARGEDVGAFLVRTGRIRQEDLQRALSRPSGAYPQAAARPSGRVPAVPPPPSPRASGSFVAPRPSAPDPALDLTIRTGPPPAPEAGALDLTIRTPTPTRPSGRQPSAPANVPGSTMGSGSSASVGGTSMLSSALAVAAGEDVPPGTLVGPYVVKKLVAKGGMGAVFVAEHSKLGRVVALKVLLSGEGATEEQLARFLVEARTSSKLNHPNVVPVYEVGEANGIHYLTMELVSGPSLRQVIRDEGPLPPRRACALAEQTARGVAAAHHEKIIHRDLKPHNVLVAPGDVAKVMDFGLAKESDQAGKGLTVSGALLGTPSYMAPEQASGERVGALADVYGLGAILYECLTGKPPFEGSTLANIITKVISQDVVPPRKVRPEIHADVETICLKALEKDPKKRYTSARAFADDLARWLAGEAILARPTSGLERVTRWARKRRQVLIPSVLGVTALVATLGYFGVIRPHLDAQAAAERQRGLEAVAREFDASVEEAGASLAALASDVGVNPAGPTAFVKKLEARTSELVRALEALEPPVRAFVRSTPPLVPAAALEAAAYLAHGHALSRERPAAASEAWAAAYAAAPGTPAGTAALAELTLARADTHADTVTATLLGRREQLAPALRARLHRWRAGRLLERMELGAAAWELEDALAAGLPAGQAAEAKRLLELVCEPWRRITDAPEVRGGRISVQGGRIFDAGPKGVVLAYDRAKGLHLAQRLPMLPEAALNGEAIAHMTATLLEPGSVPITAFYTTGNRLLVRRGEEAVTAIPRVSGLIRHEHLQFVELDGAAATAELVCAVGPNAGDGVFVRIGKDGPPQVEGLDPPGRSRGGGGACYVSSVVAGPLGPNGAARLVLGYGAWGGFDLRAFASDDVTRDARASSAQVGQCQVLQLFDITGDGKPELVAGQILGEEGQRPGHAPPGLAVYGYDDGARSFERLRTLAATNLDALDYRVGVSELHCARVRDRPLAVCRVHQDGSSGHSLGRTWVVDLTAEPPVLVMDVPMSEKEGGARWEVFASGDLDRDGDDELVVGRGPKGLRVLGLDGGEVEPRALIVASTPIDPDQEAIDVLGRYGFHTHALTVLRRRERLDGTTTATEEESLRLLAQMPTGDEAQLVSFLGQSETFIKDPARSAKGASSAHLLRAERLTRARGLERWKEAWAEVGQVDGRVDGDDAELLGRLKRVLHVREASGRVASKLVVDLTAPPALRATDIHRVSVDPRRGLVAHVNRRVRFWAGVPILVPSAILRVTIDFATRGRTWGGKAEVGLLRELGFGQSRLEGLTVGLSFWSAGTLRGVRQWMTPGIGRSSIVGDGQETEPGTIFDPITKANLATCSAGLPYLHGGRFRAILEHDPETLWTRYELHDRDREDLLVFEREGVARNRVPANLLFAGVYCTGLNGADLSGENMSPDALVIVERVEVVTENTMAVSVAVDSGGEPATRAAGLALLANGARPDVLSTYDQAMHAVEARAVPALLLQRASVLARAGDGAGALKDVRRALAADPLAFFQAVEDHGRRYHPLLAQVVAQALALELAELDAAGPQGQTLPALARRLVAHRLRHELDQGAAVLSAARALVTDAKWPEWLAYLGVSTTLSDEYTQQLKAYKPRALPELPALLPLFWAPPSDATDLDAWFTDRVRAATGLQEQLLWVQRWVAARPDAPEARRLRAEIVSRTTLRQQLFWQEVEDLRALVSLAPQQARPRLDLGTSLLLTLDYVGGGEQLRALAQGGAKAQVERRLEELDGSFLKDDVDWTAFRTAVLQPDHDWRAFVHQLARPEEVGGRADR